MNIISPIIYKRFDRKVKSRIKLKSKRRREHETLVARKEVQKRKRLEEQRKLDVKFGGLNYVNILNKLLPPNISYLINNPKSTFYLDIKKVKIEKGSKIETVTVPKNFSLIEEPKEAFEFIRNVIHLLLCKEFEVLHLNYESCENLDIGAQVLLDIIQKDIFDFYRKCYNNKAIEKTVRITKRQVGLPDLEKVPEKISKILYSVGSFAIHQNKTKKFTDIIDLQLCAYETKAENLIEGSEQKEIDTTIMVDYVIDCLKRLNKKLTPEKREDLCTVIGEILINAEEHSTTKHRFSIGYFQDRKEDGKHIGIFRLAILNFGKTIYEKFKDHDCPNQKIVEKMKVLSENYTKSGWFSSNSFEEESLWTLYALQEGVTSTDAIRGNGSIQFIESFFNIKGSIDFDEISRLTIYSGNTRIMFDGKYEIMQKGSGSEKFKVMTFNKNGNIEEKPDGDYVKFVDNYFPGTIISAKILITEDDVSYDN